MKIIEDLKKGHVDVLEAIEGLSVEQMSRPETNGKWSVRDSLLHLAWWDGEMIKALAVWRTGHEYDWSYTNEYLKFNDFWIESTKHLNVNQAVQMFNLGRLALICDYQAVSEEIWKSRGVPRWAEPIIEHTQHHLDEILEYKRGLAK